MSAKKRWFPFNAEQTLNILSEFGPLVTMFIVNAAYGIDAGTWALIITTLMAIAAMLYVFGRPPVFPLIASTVTVIFGALTLITGNPMWVQIKVTIFNAMFALFLFGGLWFKRNFFQYVFEKTFHYTEEGWNKFTWSFAWFFVFTAIANEAVRWFFPPPPPEFAAQCTRAALAAVNQCLDGLNAKTNSAVANCKALLPARKAQCLEPYAFNVLGYKLDGVNIWILFKIAFIMPLSGAYAWMLTRLMHKYRIPDPAETAHAPATGHASATPTGATDADRASRSSLPASDQPAVARAHINVRNPS